MTSTTTWRKRVPLAIALCATVLVAAGATAYACTARASMDLSMSAAEAGETVAGTGKNFGLARTEEVQIRFDAMDGAVLWSGLPDAAGNLEFSFATPEVPPGHYVLIARRAEDPNALARAAFEVLTPAGQQTPNPAPAANEGQPEQPASQEEPAQAQQQPAPVAQPAPAQANPAPATEAAPAAQAAPAEEPAVVQQPAPARQQQAAPDRAPALQRGVTMDASSQGPALLALALVGIGLVLSMGTGAYLVATNRRKVKALARLPYNLFQLFM